MRTLVTGAAGFFGAHLVRVLALRGHDVTATDLAPECDAAVARFWADAPARIAYRPLDVRHRAAVRDALLERRPDAVVHAAAITPNANGAGHAAEAVAALNAHATHTVLDLAAALPSPPRVVLASSAAVFPASPSHTALHEDAPVAPGTLYGATKLASETIARRLGRRTARRPVIVRLASLYGAMERASATREATSPIHRLAVLDPSQRVATSSVVRDYVHADDAAAAIVGLLDGPEPAYDVYHVGGGETVPWARVIAAFRAAGRRLNVVTTGPADLALAANDARPVLAIGRIVATTGFSPRAIEAGITDLVRAHGLAS